MDKSFEEIISETLGEFSNESNNVEENNEVNNDIVEESGQEDEIDESNESEEINEDEEGSENDSNNDNDMDESDEDNSNPGGNEKDIQAFISLRQENKQTKEELNKYKNTVDYFDNLAKASGLNGVDELISKYQEAELKKNAEKQGIPMEVLKRINDLEATVAKQNAYREENEAREANARVSSVLDSFIETNHLDDNSVKKIAENLVSDGINFDSLKNLPTPTISRILNSYVPKENIKQEILTKKEQIKKELPVNNDNKSSNKTQEDELDSIAKMFAGI